MKNAIPFTEKEQAEIIALARVAEGQDDAPFWKDLAERMDIREQTRPTVEPRNLTH